MKCLVTGATGYLGSHLCRAVLRRGWSLEVLVRPGSAVDRLPPEAARIELADLETGTVTNAIAAADFDVLFHLAAHCDPGHGSADFDKNLNANFLYGCRLLEGLRRRGKGALVAAGSYWQWGCASQPGPNSLYAAAKSAFLEMLSYYHLKHGVRGAALILHDVYGPGDWRNKFLSSFIPALLRGEPLRATDGTQRMAMVHVDDACAGFLQAALLLVQGDPFIGPSRAWSLDPDRPVTVRQIAEAAARLAGVTPAIEWGKLPFPPHQILEPRRLAERLPGWHPRIGLEKGLAEVILAHRETQTA